MDSEPPLIQATYMSLEMVAALEQADAVALKAEVLRQQALDTPTARWLEIVGVQYEARDAYARQKAVWVHLGSLAQGSRYDGVPISGRGIILEQELKDELARLGPLSNETSSQAARQHIQAERIARLQKYDDERLLKSFAVKGKRPVTTVPDKDRIILAARTLKIVQAGRMREVQNTTAGAPQQRVLQALVMRAVADVDNQLVALAAH